MRLFVAVDVGEAVRESVARITGHLRSEWQEVSPAACRNARFARPESAHLTLAFLGEVDEKEIRPLTRSLLKVTKPLPFEARFGGFGAFPDEVRARVLWVGVSEGTDRLVELADGIRGALREVAGIGDNGKEYVAHLTLCRFRRPQNLGRLAISRRLQETEVGTCRIDRFALMRSFLRPEGSVHEVLREFPLGGAHSWSD